LLQRARRAGVTLSAYLEQINPSDRDDPYDAYERQLMRFNIRTKDDLERGIKASIVDEFWNPRGIDGSELAPEIWMPEGGSNNTRFFASNQPMSWVLFPEYINRVIRMTPLAGDALDDLVAVTTMIDGNSYQTIYLNDTVTNRRLARVGEGAEIPRLFIKLAQQTVYLVKYAAAIEGTYEFARRVRIPIFEIWLQRIGQQLRLDMSAQAADVLVNGDGNNNAATNFNVSTLDPAAPAGPGTVTDPYLARIGETATSSITKALTYQAFVQWRTSLYTFGMTHIIGRMNELLQILTLQMPTINPTLLLGLLEGNGTVGMGRIRLPDTDLWGDAQLVYLPFAPGGLLIGMNKSMALEMLMEIGSDLTETDRNILEQTNVMTMSQNTGFDKIIPSAVSTLTFA
jgi:hypothetical protein